MIDANMHTWSLKSEFVNLQEILVDMKKTPECLEIPIPSFFQEYRKKELDKRDKTVSDLMKNYSINGTDEPEIEQY